MLRTSLSYNGVRTLTIAKALFDEGMINLPQTVGQHSAQGVVVKVGTQLWTAPLRLPPVLVPGFVEGVVVGGLQLDVDPATLNPSQIPDSILTGVDFHSLSTLFPQATTITVPTSVTFSATVERMRQVATQRAFAGTHLPRFCRFIPPVVDPPPPPPSILLYWLIPLCVVGGIALLSLFYYLMFVRPYRVFEKQYLTSREDGGSTKKVAKFDLQQAVDALDVEMLADFEVENQKGSPAPSQRNLGRSCSVFLPGMEAAGDGNQQSSKNFGRAGRLVAVKTLKGDAAFNTEQAEEEYYRKRFVEKTLGTTNNDESNCKKKKSYPKGN